MNTSASDLERLDEGLRGIRTLADDVVDELYNITEGSLDERVAGAIAWREALLAGDVPGADAWPGPAISAPVRRALTQLDLPRFTRGNPEVATPLLGDIVRAFAGADLALSRVIAEAMRKLEAAAKRANAAERAKAAQRANAAEPDPAPAPSEPEPLSAEAKRALRERVERSIALGAAPDGTIVARWGERVAAWKAVEEVFGPLGDMLGLGWNLARAVLERRGWTELAALRKLVERLPELIELVTTLGRLRAREDGPSVTETLVQAMVREVEHTRTIVVPGMPPEIRGVERSGELSRMLPMEAAFLGHPVLKHLWHARRHEHALMTYAVEGVDFAQETTHEAGDETITRPKPPQDKGPMIVCLDTSGSMGGKPEMVAKALVLEVMRTALREKREALLFQFSGPGDVAELKLDLTQQGLERLLDFLGCSFHGGTDVDAPLRRAIDRLREAAWRDADVLLVSDGHFAAPQALVADIGAAKAELGARFHGLLIGLHSSAMEALCDQVQRSTSWAQLRDG